MNIRIGMDSRYLFVRLLEPTYDGYNRIVAESCIELDKLAEVLATRIANMNSQQQKDDAK